MKLDKSNELLGRAKKCIPGLTQTFSRAATTFVEGVYPVYVKSGNGCHLIDVDGNEYLDFLMALGPITLGYCYDSVDQKVTEQIRNGVLFSLPHEIELELSELLCKTIPHAEMVKFEKSGSNAVTGAVRAARALTKRDKIAYCGSGGVWHDWQAIMVSRNAGVPRFNGDLIKPFDYNDADGLEQIFKDNPNEVAAIVIEPTYLEKPNNSFLKQVRELADKNNSVLVLDEVVTGFRFDIAGGQKFFDIKGDLVCFGKGIANGYPMAAITGPEEFMKIFDKIWVSSTNNSETLSMAATIATINEMNSKKTIEHCWSIGKMFFEGWNKTVENHNINAKMIGYPIRMTLKCYDTNNNESLPFKALLLQEMIRKGIFISPGASFISYSHTENNIQYVLDTLTEICKDLEKKIENDNYAKFLDGNLPKTIWSWIMPPVKKLNTSKI